MTMKHETKKLQAKTVPQIIASIPADTKDKVVFDEDLPGFGLRIQRGKKGLHASWIIQYRIHDGRSRRMTIANASLPAAEARKSAARELAKVKIGSDPQGEKKAKRQSGSHVFLAVAKGFIADKELPQPPKQPKLSKTYWRPSSAKQYRHILFVCCQPLHGFDISAIKRGELSSVLRRIEEQRGLRMASLTRNRLMTLFKWAMGEGLTEINPVPSTREIKYDVERERVLSDDELVRIWRACSMPENFPRGGNFGRVVKLLILLGSRRKEITGMKWGELDFDDPKNPTWTLPAERSKNHRAHTLALPPAALTILNEIARERWNGKTWAPDEYVFSTFGSMNVSRPQDTLFEQSGTKGWWLHDLRRTVATGMGNLGIAPHVIECALNHVSGFRRGVGGKYNKSIYEDEMNQALILWSEYVLALVEGRAKPRAPGKVIQWRRTA
jgi:integrase